MSFKAASHPRPDNNILIPRFREIGDIVLDLFHRDGRVADRWLALHPREFKLVWRLADHPGEPLSKQQLLSDVWRIDFEPESNSVAVHVARVRAKLDHFGLAWVLATHPEHGYFLDVLPAQNMFAFGEFSGGAID